MPIVDPGGLEALGLIGFQVNPHYVNVALPGHHGETEGAWLRVADFTVELRGPYPAVLFAGEKPPRKLMPGKVPPLFGDSA